MQRFRHLGILLLAMIFIHCRKNLLEEKPDSLVFTPTTLDDFYTLLDNETYMDKSPALGELSADDFYFFYDYLIQLTTTEQNTYIWAKNIYAGTRDIYDWNTPYQQVLLCNIALEGLEKLSPVTDQINYNNLRSIALFKRSFAFFNIAQLFSPVYDSSKAATLPGIPLKLNSDIHEPVTRASLQQSYQQIINDLKTAALLAPYTRPGTIRNRPCRAAAFALLSRIYLSMGSYIPAGKYADSSLQLHDSLLNYNNISTSATIPFRVLNAENLYTAKIPSSQYQCIQPNLGRANIDTALYQSYSNNDLRKLIYFNTTSGYPRRKSFYDGPGSTLYTGLAVDEMYLNRAECLARSGLTVSAMNYLNKLLVNRFATDSFVPLTAGDNNAALQIILEERRKELVMRGIRWSDIKRLNKEGHQITLHRDVAGSIIRLVPESSLYVLPIPDEVIQQSGIEQNIR